MKPVTMRNVEIYFSGIRLNLEIEEFKTLYHVHICDHRKYFSYLDTLRIKKQKTLKISDIVNYCYDYALNKHYF